jgi:2,5-diamino-6-(ribosylamino)-4(3H)-pyrimidinone 5'-phosphate reductase
MNLYKDIFMLPKVIAYNSVSIDCSIMGFDVNLPLHYKIVGEMGAQAILVGSDTAKSGIETFMKSIPQEQPQDRLKPEVKHGDWRPYWIIADTQAKLEGLLHVYRQSGYCKDVIILTSGKAPKSYLNYLKERNYDFFISKDDRIDFKNTLSDLKRNYGFSTIVTDSGGILISILMDQNLVTEVQLLISPEIVGKKAVNLFRSLDQPVRLKLNQTKKVKGHVLLVYKVLQGIK